MGKYDGYSWIKVGHHKFDQNKSWEENYRDLEKHHIEETKFLINKIREIDNSCSIPTLNKVVNIQNELEEWEKSPEWEKLLKPIPEWMLGDSIEARNALQNSGKVHPYTCGNNRTDEAHKAYQKEHGGDWGQLVAVEGGWLCPVCGYTQPLISSDSSTG